MDAIIASVIFVLALSLLASHWFALRAQNESRNSFLQEDASRLSESLMQNGDPANWYEQPGQAFTAGYALNGYGMGVLNYTSLKNSSVYLDPVVFSAKYKAARDLMATPAEFYITVNTSLPGSAPPRSQQLPLITIGREPRNATQAVQVRRGVVLITNNTLNTYYHYGIMTLTLWTNRSNI